VRDQYPDAKIIIFFIDIRAKDRLEDFFVKVKEDENISFFKGKVAKITEGAGRNPVLRVEDTTTEQLREIEVDLAILATGMQPTTSKTKPPVNVELDQYGFVGRDTGAPGIVGAGCVRTPVGVTEAVADGTAAALKAIQAIARR
jgi:quinone-modifying oxidoreductase subunit QmoA